MNFKAMFNCRTIKLLCSPFLCAFIFTCLSFNAEAQLIKKKPQHIDLFEIKDLGAHWGVVRQTDEGIYLCIKTTNRFEDSYATLFLGKKKDNAIQTIDDLLDLPFNEEIISVGMNGKDTKVWRVQLPGEKQTRMETFGVAGMATIRDPLMKKIKKSILSLDIE